MLNNIRDRLILLVPKDQIPSTLETYRDVFTHVIEKAGYEIIEFSPDRTLVSWRTAFTFGKGAYFTFKSIDDEEVRHGFVYERFEGDFAFYECMEA